MKSGYKIFWTNHAESELEETLELISNNPKIFPFSDKKEVHKAVLLKYNSIYYREKNNTVEILSFFSNRQNPEKRNL